MNDQAKTDAFDPGGRSHTGTPPHVDDVGCGEVWERLKADPAATLIDVRTRAEWTFVGLPDLTSLSKRVVTVEWQTAAPSGAEPSFADRLAAVLHGVGAGPETDLYFICRSGSRSRMAARAMAELGFKRCHNMEDGFEGPLDAERHRGLVGGWKASGLAWVQG